MKQYKIFKHPSGEIEAVKLGWSWPALFFNSIWMLVKKMWGLFWGIHVGLLVFGIIIFGVCGVAEEGVALIIIIGDIIAIICGAKGNSWRQKNLLSRGFEQADTVSAANPEGAVALYLKSVNIGTVLKEKTVGSNAWTPSNNNSSSYQEPINFEINEEISNKSANDSAPPQDQNNYTINKLKEYLSEPTQKRGLRIITGLFVGMCSGYGIVSILEVIVGFYGIVSNILIIIFILGTIKYSLKRDIPNVNMLDRLLAGNAIVFTIIFAFSFLYSLRDAGNHPLLENISFLDKISINSGMSFTVAIPGYISIISLFILYKKYHEIVSKYKKRNIAFFTIYICLTSILVAGKLFGTTEELTLNSIKRSGWTFVEGNRYANYNSIKTTSSGNVTIETVEADEYMVNQYMYEIDCKKKSFRNSDWVSWLGSGPMGRFASLSWEPFGSYVNPSLAKVLNEACMRTYKISLLNDQPAVFSNRSTAFSNRSTVYGNQTSAKLAHK